MSTPVIEERLYIGNIAFSVVEEDLRALFEGLQVEQVDLPLKTLFKHLKTKKPLTRPLGFGFVQFATKEDADKALERTDGKDIKGRVVTAKKAHPPPTKEEHDQKVEKWRAMKKEKRAKAQAAKAERKKAEKAAEKTEGETVAEPESETPASNGARQKKQDSKKTPEGEPSEDTVFVTNLDFKATVELLETLFEPLNPKWVHVPPKRVPRFLLKQFRANKKPLYNRGIAFVKFQDKETQQRAIEEYNGKEVNGRLIIVEAAVDSPQKAETEEPAAAEEQAPAAEETA